MTACVRCGRITLTDAVVDEPHPHHVVCIGNVVRELDDAARGWLGAFPRLSSGLDEPVLLPAATRADDEAALAELERAEQSAKRAQTSREGFLRAGVPPDPPPPSLPADLKHYVDLHRGLRLDDDTPLDDLASSMGTFAQPFALEILARRTDLQATVLGWLRDTSIERRRAGATAIGALALATPPVLGVLEDRLERSDVDDPSSLHVLLDLVMRLGPAAAALADTLHRVSARIGEGDYYLRERVLQVERRVRGPRAV